MPNRGLNQLRFPSSEDVRDERASSVCQTRRRKVDAAALAGESIQSYSRLVKSVSGVMRFAEIVPVNDVEVLPSALYACRVKLPV